jgi:hypothetical protein
LIASEGFAVLGNATGGQGSGHAGQGSGRGFHGRIQ